MASAMAGVSIEPNAAHVVVADDGAGFVRNTAPALRYRVLGDARRRNGRHRA